MLSNLTIITVLLLFSSAIYSQELKVEDASSNTLFEIYDEGTAGSILLPSFSSITTSTNKLYNLGGSLYWNGTALGIGNASSINDLTDGKTDATSLFLGLGAGANDDGTVNENTSIGISSLTSNTSGYKNTAVGYNSLYSNTEGYLNTAVGNVALNSNTSGDFNTAIGHKSLYSNISGNENTAIGLQTLFSNTASYNTAVGFNVLLKRITIFQIFNNSV